MSYQPEERYWSDYLRIALPVVGLLLMLGLFWFWAANLIGDDDDDNPPATIIGQNETPAITPTPIGTTVVPGGNDSDDGDDATEPVETLPAGDGDETEEATEEPDDEDLTPTDVVEEEDPTETPEEDPVGDGPFAPDELVTVISDNVRFRPAPNTEETEIRFFEIGEELTIVDGEIVEADGFSWVEVEDSDGEQGWVAIDFIESAE